MECVHCNWFSLSGTADPVLPEGRCAFTGMLLDAAALEAEGVHACATKSLREWEREQRQDMPVGRTPVDRPLMAAATAGYVAADGWRQPERSDVAAAVAGNAASRPVVMLSAAEWRIGYAGHVRTRRDPNLDLRLAQTAPA